MLPAWNVLDARIAEQVRASPAGIDDVKPDYPPGIVRLVPLCRAGRRPTAGIQPITGSAL